MDAERREKARAEKQALKEELCHEHGVTFHPKAEQCFELAWEFGHAAGLGEVRSYFEQLVVLLNK